MCNASLPRSPLTRCKESKDGGHAHKAADGRLLVVAAGRGRSVARARRAENAISVGPTDSAHGSMQPGRPPRCHPATPPVLLSPRSPRALKVLVHAALQRRVEPLGVGAERQLVGPTSEPARGSKRAKQPSQHAVRGSIRTHTPALLETAPLRTDLHGSQELCLAAGRTRRRGSSRTGLCSPRLPPAAASPCRRGGS